MIEGTTYGVRYSTVQRMGCLLVGSGTVAGTVAWLYGGTVGRENGTNEGGMVQSQVTKRLRSASFPCVIGVEGFG